MFKCNEMTCHVEVDLYGEYCESCKSEFFIPDSEPLGDSGAESEAIRVGGPFRHDWNNGICRTTLNPWTFHYISPDDYVVFRSYNGEDDIPYIELWLKLDILTKGKN